MMADFFASHQLRTGVFCVAFQFVLAEVLLKRLGILTDVQQVFQIFGAAGYSRNNPLERMVRDARMFTIGGGTAQVLRTLVASHVLDTKLPQTRGCYIAQAVR